MAEPMRNPRPLTNQELEGDEQLVGMQIEQIGTGVQRGLSTRPEIGKQEKSPGKVIEFKQAVVEKLENAKEVASSAVQQVKQRAEANYEEVQSRLSEVYRRSANKMRETAGHARVRAHQYRDEHPLGVIMIAAGVGFTLGVLLRIWRSNRYE